VVGQTPRAVVFSTLDGCSDCTPNFDPRNFAAWLFRRSEGTPMFQNKK